MFLNVRGEVFLLTSSDGVTVKREEIHEIQSNQEETDTRVILYAAYASRMQYKNVQIRSPDSDIFFLLLHFASQLDTTLFFDTGVGNSKRLLNITDIAKDLGEQKCTSLMTLHVFTGVDTPSAFNGIGKVKPIKLLLKENKFMLCFTSFGICWDVDDSNTENLEQFTCSMYGYPRYTSIGLLR